MMIHGGEPSRGAQYLSTAAFSFSVAWAVETDRRAHAFSAPFEYSAFMFFLWWALLPFYLYRTRRKRGLAIYAAVFIASFLPYLAALATYMLLA
ncbi:hypothetical protein D0B54_04430 [Solimonas sp. K1W22B-7]|uniref:hypothetical protein n=1 Tax=Solimonas sp. K1W22B-7 TaxID=2303331 RepID=UPI000E32FBA2|nr:hypothetical protein [Solimonas sp. K1W22B-7]AXQ27967.1 hypothetical protein D0B54_04430 [Solimonas sp. K1W22B-7]